MSKQRTTDQILKSMDRWMIVAAIGLTLIIIGTAMKIIEVIR